MPAKQVPYEILIHRAETYFKFRDYELASKILKIPRTTLVSQIKQFERYYPKDYKKLFESDSPEWSIPNSRQIELSDCCVVVGGDLHAWPNQVPIMWKAFCDVAKKIKPKAIILNGDIIDGARVSRHAKMLNSRLPKLSEELEAVQNLLKMLPNAQYRLWTMGNHDQRVDNYLAQNAPELDDYAGMLSDRFPNWEFSYAVHVNNVEVRHRFRGGIHTAWNNALHSGISMVTNHTHQLQVTAVRNRNGSHWGIETGMLGDPNGRQFEYTEGAPSRAQEGFVVLSFDEDGYLLPPEFCEMVRGHPIFRGKRVF